MVCRLWRTSLKGFPCVKAANHAGNHRRADGKEWPEGQTWKDVVATFIQQQAAALGVCEWCMDELNLGDHSTCQETVDAP